MVHVSNSYSRLLFAYNMHKNENKKRNAVGWDGVGREGKEGRNKCLISTSTVLVLFCGPNFPAH